MSTARIIEGTFALVSSGNCTQSWMVDGEDIQARANAALDPYWGTTATVHQRGVKGFGIDAGGRYLAEVYLTRQAAENALDPAYQSKMDKAKHRSGAEWA